ncbi:competence/damage-inducible protein A [Halosimplex aquaticum]|uniref:Competence/damage-inducible protein A n=1 Tax=Halosimplex aquaticum TaxID=3026162 RepID=A0ABD5Y609_9EURY|nr:molybdopterin-binding protein [Halosimplex aquaticum]
MRVAIVTVGDELLVGDTVNTNAAWLGERLHERGVDVERVTTLPDRVADIARVVNEYRAEYDAVLVTGGVGPTHDDVTMEGVAAAFGREVVESQEVLDWLEAEGGYAADDLAEGTAEIPRGARLLENPEGVAPGCVIGSVYVLPGVPTEMKAMFETVADDFAGEVKHVATVVADEPESALLDRIDDLRRTFDVTVGSYPGDSVRIRIQGDEGEVEDAAAWLRDRVDAPDAE